MATMKKMIKCPNCGRTKQVKIKHIPSPNPNRIIQQSICDCGCITNSVFALMTTKTWAPDGTPIETTKGSE